MNNAQEQKQPSQQTQQFSQQQQQQQKVEEQDVKNQQNNQQQQPLSDSNLVNQDEELDADIQQLKQKLKVLKDKKAPENKDDLIQHLMEKLECAELAIQSCEEVISQERENRKRISKELTMKNQELREIVNAEKKKLQDKVHEELEKTIQQALREKMYAESQLEEIKKLLVERDMKSYELDAMYMTLRDEHKNMEKLNSDQQKIIEHLEEELQQTKEERDTLSQEKKDNLQQIEKLNVDLDEAYSVITKLEEARIVLNRLLGQNGVLTQRERQKFLKADNQQLNSIDSQSQGQINERQIDNISHQKKQSDYVGTNNKMLSQNNDYFYDVGMKNRQQYGNNQGAVLDDGNEDEFWYQSPKVGQTGYNEHDQF